MPSDNAYSEASVCMYFGSTGVAARDVFIRRLLEYIMSYCLKKQQRWKPIFVK